jgi:hypothetical protein
MMAWRGIPEHRSHISMGKFMQSNHQKQSENEENITEHAVLLDDSLLFYSNSFAHAKKRLHLAILMLKFGSLKLCFGH